MNKKIFQFKHFRIDHTNAPFKIGTDGTLLGCWANYNNPKNILDVGTGCGLIALMMDQRFPYAKIEAIEINEEAHKVALHNFQSNKKNIELHLGSYQDLKPKENFDLIVCNPPFFENSLTNENKGKTLARHTKSLSFEELLKKSYNLLNTNGKLNIVLPINKEAKIDELANSIGLYISRICKVFPTPEKPAKRMLFELSKQPSQTEYSEITIEKGRHSFHESYVKIAKDFYLDEHLYK